MIKIPGQYSAKVNSANVNTNEKNGNAYLSIGFITEEKETALAFLHLTEKAFDGTVKRLKEVFNFNGDFADMGQFLEKQARITVEEDKDQNGKTKYDKQGNALTTIKWVNAPAGGKNKASLDIIAKLNAKTGAPVPAAKTEESANEPF